MKVDFKLAFNDFEDSVFLDLKEGIFKDQYYQCEHSIFTSYLYFYKIIFGKRCNENDVNLFLFNVKNSETKKWTSYSILSSLGVEVSNDIIKRIDSGINPQIKLLIILPENRRKLVADFYPELLI